MSFPMFIPIGFGYGGMGSMGWKATLFFLGLLGGMLGMLIGVLTSALFFEFNFNPAWIEIWFAIGVQFGLLVAIRETWDEIKSDFNKRIDNPQHYSFKTSFTALSIINAFGFGCLYFLVPFLESYSLGTLPEPISFMPTELQDKINSSIDSARTLEWILIPTVTNLTLIPFILFKNWQYNREMKLRAKEI